MIVNPRGETVAGPLIDEEGIMYADVDPLVAVERARQGYCGALIATPSRASASIL